MNGRAALERLGNQRPDRVRAGALHLFNSIGDAVTAATAGAGAVLVLPSEGSPFFSPIRRPDTRRTPCQLPRALGQAGIFILGNSLRREAWQLRATEGGANASPSVCVSSFRHVHKHGENDEQAIPQNVQGVAGVYS